MRYQIFSKARGDALNICYIGYGSNPEITRFGPGQRKLYIIHYVLSGKGYFNSNPVSAGEGFLIRPEAYECYYPDKKDAWSFIWIVSDDEKMNAYFEKYNANPDTGIFKYNPAATENAKSYILKNNNAFLSPDELLEFYLHIFNRQLINRNSSIKNSDLYLDYAVSYIKTNLFRPIRISELTKILGITQPYLYRIFTEKYGISPSGYIHGCKLEEAKYLLAETRLSVTETANSVGFENVLDFSKFFKHRTGISPQDFRKSVK